MLAIVSDLHFCDRTAVEKNVDPAAFKAALAEIYEEAHWIAAEQKRTVHLDLVLLGDVFDLLRTERWFEAPLEERPWGSVDALDGAKPSAGALARAGRILDDIVVQNKEALDTLSGRSFQPGPDVEVRRILLPGNHDRLALHDEDLYARMRAAVGAADERTLSAEGVYPHRLVMHAYGLLARHGHEWDLWNFESFDPAARAHYEDDKYLPAPIGDPITTELVAGLPYEVKLRLADVDGLSPAEKCAIYARLQRIEDVRPMLASLQWAYHETGCMSGTYGQAKADLVRVALDDTVRTLAKRFLALPFYRAWHERHSSLLHPFSKATQLRAALEALSVVNASSQIHLLLLLDKLGSDDDENLDGAKGEDLAHIATQGLRFVVYGHTHEAEVVPLHTIGLAEDMYLNTGTFRQRVFRTEDKQGFIASDYMTYVYFFSDDEAAAWRKHAGSTITGPAYTAWTGMRSR